VTIAPESLPDDIAALKRIIAEMVRDAVTAKAEIAKLKFQLARYRRAEFGRSSEKLAREVEQLELAIESLETDQAERLAAASPAIAAAIEDAVEKQKPARRALPEHLPREEVRHPAACTCPHCGGGLRRIGEEVSETLDYVPGRFKVIRQVREKLSCRACDTVIAAPAPDHAIARGRAGAGLLAHIVVSKFDDHLPLYRQAEIFAREGVSLETSTLSGWVGATAAALKPLVDALAADVIAGETLYVDDTPVPVLAPGTGKPRPAGCGLMFATSGRLPARARRRRCSSIRPTGKASTQRRISRTSRGSSTPTAIPGSTGSSPATGSPRPPAGPTSRRKFFDGHAANGSSIAKQALDRIGDLYGIEKTITGRPTCGALNARNDQSRLLLRWAPGPRRPCRSPRANPNWPRLSAICARAGRHCCAASMTAGSPLTIRPSELCAASPSAARIICSPAPMPEAAARPRFTR
jgi:transposase